MIFITLGKFKHKPSKNSEQTREALVSAVKKEGGKILGSYWTLGAYDFVTIVEAPETKAIENAMKGLLRLSDNVTTETLVALKRETQ